MTEILNIKSSLHDYLNHFHVSKEILQKVITAAMDKGGTYADLYFESKISNDLALEDGKVNQAASNVDFGVGIRVLKDNQTGYAYSETLTLPAMLRAANMAASIANDSSTYQPVNINLLETNSFYNIKKEWSSVSIEDKIPFVQNVNNRVFELDEKVIKAKVYLADNTKSILFFNSDGVLAYDYQPMVKYVVYCLMEKDGRVENGYASRSFRKGFEWLTADLVDELAKEVVAKTNILFEAIKPKAGEMPVVMGAGGSGILLHEAIGHTFEADFNRKGTSIFSDMLGKQVAKDFINIIDDGTVEGNRGAINMDDEGVLSQKTYLVKDGVLNSYLHDRISANFYNVAPTGNGRRESFRNIPLPRMRATYMEDGNSTQQDLISEIKYGVYVDNFSNGQVQIGAGDFTFFVKSGFLIENGKITQPIKDINIIGNGPKALADISMAANDFKIDNGTWTCGKNGQSVPVTCGLPSVLVDKLTVGGIS